MNSRYTGLDEVVQLHHVASHANPGVAQSHLVLGKSECHGISGTVLIEKRAACA